MSTADPSPPPSDRASDRATADQRLGVARRVEQDRIRAELRGRLFGAAVAPTEIGRFRLLRRLGAGVTGVVYAAHDPRLERDVAVKLVILGAPDDDAMLREARALARCSHPNLLPVFEVGDHAGIPFIVSELVDGGSLRSWLTPPPPPAHALEVVTAIGRGIAEAHRRGIVHRDLKPENVLLGSDGRPRVADFGLARRFDHSVDPGPLPGTPAYMAPEHRRGDSADPRSDQYSFCVLAFEALFARFPAADEHAQAAPPDHPLAHLHPVLARGLLPTPAQRWPSMDALLEALVEAPQRDGAGAPHRDLATSRHLAISGIAIGAALLLGAALWLASRGADRRPPTAPAPRDEAAEIFLAVNPMLQTGRFADCADYLATRAKDDPLRSLWVQCALQVPDLERLVAACAAWTAAAPTTVAGDCEPTLMRARQLAAAGRDRECADLLMSHPPARETTLVLTRCVGKVDDPTLTHRQCVYLQGANGHPTPETSCGPPP